jgi:hypothetical protein
MKAKTKIVLRKEFDRALMVMSAHLKVFKKKEKPEGLQYNSENKNCAAKKFDQCNKGIVSAIAQNTENEIKKICICTVAISSPSGYDTCCWLCLERSLFLP